MKHLLLFTFIFLMTSWSSAQTNYSGIYTNYYKSTLTLKQSGDSLSYHLEYTGEPNCDGFIFEGVAIISSDSMATSGDIEYPLIIRLRKDEVNFEPSCCDGSVDMDCLRVFDNKFIKTK